MNEKEIKKEIKNQEDSLRDEGIEQIKLELVIKYAKLHRERISYKEKLNILINRMKDEVAEKEIDQAEKDTSDLKVKVETLEKELEVKKQEAKRKFSDIFIFT